MNRRFFDTIAMSLLTLVVVCVADRTVSNRCLQLLGTYFFDLAIVDEVYCWIRCPMKPYFETANADEIYYHLEFENV